MASLKPLSDDALKALPKDAAGRKMTAAVLAVEPTMAIGAVRRLFAERVSQLEVVRDIYVTDPNGVLIGVLSVKELFELPQEHPVGESCTKDGLISVTVRQHQERVAYLALRHHLRAVPVVDDAQHLLGVVPGETILRILYKEMHEDILRGAGVSRRSTGDVDDVLSLSVWRSFIHRAPWLLLGLVGGLAIAGVIKLFDATLERDLLLAAFIPLIVYMGDAVGTQMEAFIIRDIAIDRDLRFWPYFFRQFSVVALLAVLFGIVSILGVFLLFGHFHTALIIGIALCAAVLSSVCTGLIVPYLFSRLRLDPANASGPTATVLQDFFSVLVYFLVAQLLL